MDGEIVVFAISSVALVGIVAGVAVYLNHRTAKQRVEYIVVKQNDQPHSPEPSQEKASAEPEKPIYRPGTVTHYIYEKPVVPPKEPDPEPQYPPKTTEPRPPRRDKR